MSESNIGGEAGPAHAESNIVAIYHGPTCPDGFACSWLLHKVYPDALFVAASYGDPPPDVVGKEVFIVDFSFPRPVMEQMISESMSLVCLDHHRSAQQALAGLGDDNDMVLIIFDMERSGARLTYDYLTERGHLKNDFCAWLVEYAQDRDLWRHKLPMSREVNAALASFPMDWLSWEYVQRRGYQELVNEGCGILRYQQQLVDLAVKNAYEVDFLGHRVLMANATTLISEIGEQLCKGRPFSVTWFKSQQGKYIYSLRSDQDSPDSLDVSEIAKRLGGGGHPHASGFTCEYPEPISKRI